MDDDTSESPSAALNQVTSPQTTASTSRPTSRGAPNTSGRPSRVPSMRSVGASRQSSPETLRSDSPTQIGPESVAISRRGSTVSVGSDAGAIEFAVNQSSNILDHRKVVSTLPYNPIDHTGKKLQQYLVLSKKNVIKPSFALKEGEYKKFGRMHKYSRNVYVPGYEQIDITVSNGKACWTGYINYAEHNVLRKRGGRDESWSVEKFFAMAQMTLQYPEVFDGMEVSAAIEKAKESKGLILKLRAIRNGIQDPFIKPCVLSLVPDDENDSKPKAPAKLFAETFNINNRHLLVACRTNNLERAKLLMTKAKGNFNINFVDEFSGWSIFQFVCYHGHYDFARYMLTDFRETLLKDYISPHDGNTAMHCAVMSGDVELVKMLISFEVIPDFVNSNGETPSELALIKRHKSIVEYFYGDESTTCIEGRKLHGVRSKEIKTMYVYLKPPREYDPNDYEWEDDDDGNNNNDDS